MRRSEPVRLRRIEPGDGRRNEGYRKPEDHRADTARLAGDGAAHLFEEPGTLDAVAEAAGAWFTDKFAAGAAASSGTK